MSPEPTAQPRQFIRWTVVRTRGGSEDVHLGGIEFRGRHGEYLHIAESSCGGGAESLKGYGPWRLHDGDGSTWWRSRRKGHVMFTVQGVASVASYRFMTGGGKSASDPSQWSLHIAASPEGPWSVFHRVESSFNSMPAARHAWTTPMLPLQCSPLPHPQGVLGLPDGPVTLAEVETAYKSVALRTHPGLGGWEETARFCRAAEAYTVLLAQLVDGMSFPDEAPLVEPHEIFNRVLGYTWRLAGASPAAVSESSPSSSGGRLGASLNKMNPMGIVDSLRSACLYEFNKELSSEALRELSVLHSSSAERPSPEVEGAGGGVEVVLIRHGMGHHNDLMGACSGMNRDSELNRVGVLQAQRLGCVLRSAGGFPEDTLVVVSPFRRALQTSVEVLGDSAKKLRTIVTPLAAEHTLYRSAVQKGDRGSSADMLRGIFPTSQFPQFDFSEVVRYCDEKGVSNGRWWHHAPHPSISETYESFRRRADEFRAWLGRTAKESGARRVVVFSHGGLLTTSFGRPHYGNCGFRVFSVMPDGGARRCTTGEVLTPPAHGPLPGIPREDSWLEIESRADGRQLWVEAVRRCSHLIDGHWVFRVQAVLDDEEEVVAFMRLSALRRLHDDVKRALKGSYKDYDLQGLFPAPHWRRGIAKGAETWLQQLCVVMGDVSFPGEVRDLVHRALAQSDAQMRDGNALPPTRPTWVPDQDAAHCYACKKGFHLMRRRHHCRLCGELVCSKCSPHDAPVEGEAKPQRVCTACHDIVSRTEHFPQRLKVQSATQSDANGVYVKAAWHVNSMPFYTCTSDHGGAAWYLFSGGGLWWVSSSQQDFRKGGGVMCGSGETPDAVVDWRTSADPGVGAKELVSVDPCTIVKCASDSTLVQEEEEDEEEWLGFASDCGSSFGSSVGSGADYTCTLPSSDDADCRS